MHILIVRVSAIGDVIHTLPALFLLKHHFPDAKFHWVVQKKAASLLVGQPFIDQVWQLPDHFLRPAQWPQTLRTIKALRHSPWDAIIDFQGLLKTALLTLPLSGKKYGFTPDQAREKASSWFTHHHDRPVYTNIVQKNLSLASAAAYHLGSTDTSPSPDELQQQFQLAVPADQQRLVDHWFEDNRVTNALLLCPNTTWPSKHWPEEHWVTFIDLLTGLLRGGAGGNGPQIIPNNINNHVTPILVGTTFGPAAAKIATLCHKKNISTLICPSWDLVTMSHLIKQSTLLIAPDTGLLHLADYLGTPAIGLFGPSHKEKHGPFWTKSSKDLTIQIPCPHTYQKTHGKGSAQNCMAVFTPQQLLDQVVSYLEKRAQKALQ